MTVPFKEVPGSPPIPDVDAIVQRVQAGAAAKLARGVYPPESLAEVRRDERAFCARDVAGLIPADDIALLHSSWDPLGPHAFTSHRAGVGKLVVGAKRILRRLVRPVAAVSLARQTEFNGAVARLLGAATDDVQSLAADNAALLRRLDEVECRNRQLDARCDQLQVEVRELRARLEPDGDTVRSG